MNFLRRKHRWHLLETANSVIRQLLKLITSQNRSNIRALRLPIAVVCVRSKTEPEAGGVALTAPCVELHQACGATKQQDEYARSEWIERAEVSHLAKASEMAHCVHDIVGRFAWRLVYDERAIERRGLRLTRHGLDLRR